ncbi:MAG: hypothetical protein Q8O43_08490 [Dehalococcoidia bacterium]|nr:hypothetical protein [Dehalococcoidia bacterium]
MRVRGCNPLKSFSLSLRVKGEGRVRVVVEEHGLQAKRIGRLRLLDTSRSLPAYGGLV